MLLATTHLLARIIIHGPAAMILCEISFFDFCQMGRLHPKKEPPIPTQQRDHKIGAVRDTNTRSDVLLLTGARPRAVDFAVTSPLQPLYLTGAAQETGYAAERYAVDVKEKRYATEFAKQGIDFTPMV